MNLKEKIAAVLKKYNNGIPKLYASDFLEAIKLAEQGMPGYVLTGDNGVMHVGFDVKTGAPSFRHWTLEELVGGIVLRNDKLFENE